MRVESGFSPGYTGASHRLNRLERKEAEAEQFEDKLAALRREIVQQKLPSALEEAKKEEEQDNGEALLVCATEEELAELSGDELLARFTANLAKLGDFSLDSKIDPTVAIDHMASQYAVFRNYLGKTGTEEQLEALDSVFESRVNRYARQLASEVGGFFESRGMTGERERMFDSVKNRIYSMTEGYVGFLKERPGLLAGSSVDRCFATDLRLAYRKAGDEEERGPDAKGAYTRREISAATALVRQVRGLEAVELAGGVSDEELALRLGKVSLKALAHLDGSKATQAHKAAFRGALSEHMDKVMDESDVLLLGGQEDEAKPVAQHPINREKVWELLDAMETAFQQTQSLAAALLAGQQLGLHSFLARAAQNPGEPRYQNAGFWNHIASQMVHVDRLA